MAAYEDYDFDAEEDEAMWKAEGDEENKELPHDLAENRDTTISDNTHEPDLEAQINEKEPQKGSLKKRKDKHKVRDMLWRSYK